MTKELMYAIDQLYMRSQCKYLIESSRLHYTAVPFQNGTYVAILREDGYVEDDFVEGLILASDEDGYYDIP